MQKVVSWIRECDRELFARFFQAHPDVQLSNAREQHADVETAGGLLLTGGDDIAAEFLHQEIPDPAVLEPPEPNRDPWEFDAVRVAMERRLPIFAICKGMQVLNVALGGTLLLDIRGHDLPELRDANVQPLRFANGVAQRFDEVNSSHHQAVDRPGNGLEVEAWCATDDIIEQMRMPRYNFGLAVQYHPERDGRYAALFKEFIAAVLKN
jgi:putative glutamine amidotransferase